MFVRCPPPVLVAGVLSDSASSLASHTISAERLSRFSRRVFDWRLASFVFLVCFVLLLGAEHVSFSAVMTLAHAGVKSVAMVTPEPAHASYLALRWATGLLYGYQLLTNATVVEIMGGVRVEAVRVRMAAGHERLIECDTVVFTADWVPDYELARRAGLRMTDATKSPAVDIGGKTSRAGVYAVGNLILPIKAADQCALEGRALARVILEQI